jgi:hypothetical protein
MEAKGPSWTISACEWINIIFFVVCFGVKLDLIHRGKGVFENRTLSRNIESNREEVSNRRLEEIAS